MDALAALPEPCWTISSTHAMAGRLRLKLSPRLRDTERAHELAARLESICGIRRVDVSALTGSLLIVHDRALSDVEITAAVSERLAARIVTSTGEPTRSSPGHAARVLREQPCADDPVAAAWRCDADRLAQALATSAQEGLDSQQAALRLRQGSNTLPEIPPPTLAQLLRSQLSNLPTGLLGASALLSLLTGGVPDAIAIVAVLAINAAIGASAELRSEKIIRSLNVGAPATVAVVRNGRTASVAFDSIVPGDLLILSVGTYVAADARLVHADELSIDESTLTGESVPVAKDHRGACAAGAPLSDRANMVYRGTIVTGGTGRALVVATGLNTELGRIQTAAMGAAAPVTPLQQELERTSRQLVMLSGAACLGVLGLGVLRGMPWIQLVKLTISLGVAAIPEGLPAVATSTLALAVRRMGERGMAVRRLGAIEALGSMDTLCFDKTGTLTQNRMQVVGVAVGSGFIVPLEQDGVAANEVHPDLQRLLQIIVLCNDAELREDGALSGSATEAALLKFAHRFGVAAMDVRRAHARTAAQYRSEGRRYMVTSHRTTAGGLLLAAKGSPAELLERAAFIVHQGALRPMEPEHRESILRRNEAWADGGLRVLGVAYAETPLDGNLASAAFIWLGLVALSDPPRAGVDTVLAQLREAGVRPLMITGDQAATAATIAMQLNLAAGAPLRVAEVSESTRSNPELLRALVQHTNVFARSTPSMKLSIIRALQDDGRIVGMTGDGVNDGPALRAANVGFAMGGATQDVARSVADVVIERDELQTMLTAIAEGRTIYDNVRNAIRYLLATNFSELQIMTAALAVGAPAPLSPMQLLWINLLTDILPALGLALEPAAPDVLRTKPREARRPILSRADAPHIVRESLALSTASFGSYVYGLWRYGPGPQASTQAFATLTFAQLLHALTCRSNRSALVQNTTLDVSLCATGALQCAALFLPWTRRVLGAVRPGWSDWLMIAAFSTAPMLVNELLNHWERIAREDEAVNARALRYVEPVTGAAS